MREKGIEHSKVINTNTFGAPAITNTTLNQEPSGFIQPSGRSSYHANNQNKRSAGETTTPWAKKNQQIG